MPKSLTARFTLFDRAKIKYCFPVAAVGIEFLHLLLDALEMTLKERRPSICVPWEKNTVKRRAATLENSFHFLNQRTRKSQILFQGKQNSSAGKRALHW